jgi:hypothetical protein
MEIVGTRGFKGKKTKNSNTMFNRLFDEETVDSDEHNSVLLDNTDLDKLIND